MKRSVTYILISLALGIAIWLALDRKPDSTMDETETAFAIKDIGQIYKIFMVDKEGNKVELSRRELEWMVNDKYPVMPGIMGELLKTVQRVQISRPVPEAEHNAVVKQISTDGIKVEIYDQENRLLKKYFVGGPTLDHLGTYMILAGKDGNLATRPYITHIPGFSGYLTVRYFTDEQSWRSRKIIDLRADQIQSVRLNYSDGGAFELRVFDKDSFQLFPLGESPRSEAPEKMRIGSYLESFADIHAETFQNQDLLKDSVLAMTPWCELSIKSLVSRDENRITIFLMGVNERTKGQIDAAGNPASSDPDRYYALVNQGRDFAVIQHFVFGKILRRYPDFFMSQNPS